MYYVFFLVHAHRIKLHEKRWFVFTNYSNLTVLSNRWIFQSICFHVWFLWTATFGRSCLGMYLLLKFTTKELWAFTRAVCLFVIYGKCLWSVHVLVAWMCECTVPGEKQSCKAKEVPANCMASPQGVDKVESLTFVFSLFLTLSLGYWHNLFITQYKRVKHSRLWPSRPKVSRLFCNRLAGVFSVAQNLSSSS